MYCIVSTDAHDSHDLMETNHQREFYQTEEEADISGLHPGINKNSVNNGLFDSAEGKF